jgi:hypothetical protein
VMRSFILLTPYVILVNLKKNLTMAYVWVAAVCCRLVCLTNKTG